MEFESAQSNTTAKLPILKLGEYEMWVIRIKQYFQDLEQIYEDDLEAMDLKWRLSLLSIRAKKYYQKTGKKIFINANDTDGYDKSKVECYSYHKLGHFSRECRAPRSKEGQFRNQDNTRKQGNNEDTSSKAMLAIDGVGFDWSDMAEKQVQTNMALMAFSDSDCDDLIVKLNQTEFTEATYKRDLATVEAQLITYRKDEGLFSEEVVVLKREVACKDYEIIYLVYIVSTASIVRSDDEIPPPQTPTQQAPHTVSTIKLPIMKKGNTPKTAEEILLPEKRERKARTTVLMALPEDHLAKFHNMIDAKDIWDAIKSRFGGNDESKKMQKYILKQQITGFFVSNSEGLHKGYDSFVSSESKKIRKLLLASTNNVSIAYGVSTSFGYNSQRENSLYTNELMYSSFSNQSSAPHLDHEIWDGARLSKGENGYKFKRTMEGWTWKKHEEPKALVNLAGEGVVDWSESLQRITSELCFDGDLQANSGSDTGQMEVKGTNLDLGMEIKYMMACIAVPPPMTGNFNAFRTDKEVDDLFVIEPNVVSQPKVWPNAPIIEEYESDSDDEYDNPQRALKNKGIVDSGCSRHMTGNKAYLAEYQDYNGGPVAFGGSKGYITGKDTECLVLSSDFKLPDENQVLLRIPRQNNMYSFNLENIVPSRGLACLIAKATIDESNKWHRRLGHVNFKNLNKLVKGNLVRGLPSKIFQNDHTCVACQKGKQHKASCKAKIVSSISQPLQLLHMDLFGPTSVRSINHKTYCLVITDDFSRFSWVFFLRTKDETSGILKDFIRQIENQLNQKVKTIRCDNGTEFKNRDIIEFCGSKGIKREYSNARTPQQNGVAERKNRTLIKAARTMLADSFLPNTFWAEAVSTACYVLNRVLVTKPQNKTPYELITGKIPIISYIRPFGCHVTILNTIDHLGKFEGKSDEEFLVGYSLNSKDFRVYNLETKRVEENLHINFLENKPNVAGKGPNWLFDLDYLTDSMNYQPVRSENQANKTAGPKEANHSAVKSSETNNEGKKTIRDTGLNTNEEPVDKEDQSFLEELERLKRQEKEANDAAEALRKEFAQDTKDLLLQAGAARATSTNTVNTASTPVSNDSPSNAVSTVVDFTNLESTVNVSPIPTLRIHSIHPTTQILEDPKLAVQTRSKVHKSFGAYAFRIFRYLKGKPKLGLWYPRVSSFDLEAYLDSDYAGANLDRKSTTGGCQFLGRRLISWQCKKQTIVATSTTKAEYVAAANCRGQNPVFHSKTKHIKIRHHFIRDAYEKKLIQVLKIHTDDNVADLLTKAFDVSSVGFYHHTTNGHQFTMSNIHQELASPKQTVSGKDFSNLLIVDSLLKTIWFINAPCFCNEALAIPGKTETGKELSNPLMAGSLPKTTLPPKLLE
ncbi:putative ribonuclease H-like domain-containing protein [Tanacetum coccineum]|uniref:Ribonuclease H-like domain-containing protein n=1 Tax=Tanacetum coccineum TaxID=301880 RepID=A0ABQ5A6Z3_9ASTR